MNPHGKYFTVVKSKSCPISESIKISNDIEEAYQEDRSNATSSFSLFVDFEQYGTLPFVRLEEEEEEEEEQEQEKNEEDDDEEDEEEDMTRMKIMRM